MAEFSWWRSWHGAPLDPKWAVIAARSGVKTGIVSAIAWALLDYASQQKERGSIEGFDQEVYAVYSGFNEADITAVISAMYDKGLLKDGRWNKWEDRQPKSEAAIAKVTEWREKKRAETKSNYVLPSVTESYTDESREDKRREDAAVVNDSPPSPNEWTPEEGIGSPLSAAFEKASGIPMHDPPRWCETITDMEKLGLDADDIRIAVSELRKKGYNINGPWSVRNAAINVHGKRNGQTDASVRRRRPVDRD
jgi:hypothetical protein